MSDTNFINLNIDFVHRRAFRKLFPRPCVFNENQLIKQTFKNETIEVKNENRHQLNNIETCPD